MDLYQGKSTKPTLQEGIFINLGSRVALSMVKHLQCPLEHEICIDNFFTSYVLLAHTRSHESRVTDTVRANRTGKCPFKDDKLMKKESRGDMYYRFDCEEILYVK